MLHAEFKKILIKIGSKILFDNNYQSRKSILESITSQIANLIKSNRQVILVSSGAVMAGRAIFPNNDLAREVYASVGQAYNISNYSELFLQHNINIGQVLMNKADLIYKGNQEKLKSTFEVMLDKKILPIVNQNDLFRQDEDFIDNDALSLYISKLVDIELVVFLTDVDGLLTVAPPEPNGEVIKDIYSDDFHVLKFIKTNKPGGMKSKVDSAMEIAKNGTYVYITNGLKEGTLNNILHDKQLSGSLFHPNIR